MLLPYNHAYSRILYAEATDGTESSGGDSVDDTVSAIEKPTFSDDYVGGTLLVGGKKILPSEVQAIQEYCQEYIEEQMKHVQSALSKVVLHNRTIRSTWEIARNQLNNSLFTQRTDFTKILRTATAALHLDIIGIKEVVGMPVTENTGEFTPASGTILGRLNAIAIGDTSSEGINLSELRTDLNTLSDKVTANTNIIDNHSNTISKFNTRIVNAQNTADNAQTAANSAIKSTEFEIYIGSSVKLADHANDLTGYFYDMAYNIGQLKIAVNQLLDETPGISTNANTTISNTINSMQWRFYGDTVTGDGYCYDNDGVNAGENDNIVPGTKLSNYLEANCETHSYLTYPKITI